MYLNTVSIESASNSQNLTETYDVFKWINAKVLSIVLGI